MTAIGSGDAQSNRVLSASPADWISPHTDAWGGVGNVPVADGAKVSLLDSDHWFVIELYRNPVLGRQWVWKSFCRGHNPILMEHLPPQSMVLSDCPLTPDDPGYSASREAMGHARRLAERINLAAMTPSRDLASTGYCLADPGKEYLVYVPEGGEVAVDLSAASTDRLNVNFGAVLNDVRRRPAGINVDYLMDDGRNSLLSPQRRLREALRELGPGYLRYPGGWEFAGGRTYRLSQRP